MNLFIAMPDDAAYIIDHTKTVTRESLKIPMNIHYLPFKDNEDSAKKAARLGNTWNVPTARVVTSWKLLKITVPQATAFEMVQQGILTRQVSRSGWNLFGDLDFSSFAHAWFGHLPSVGVDAWSKEVLMVTFKTIPDVICQHCKKKGPAWRGHCVNCWLNFLEDSQTD